MCVLQSIGATLRRGLPATAAVLLWAAAVNAQDAPAHLAYVDGAVSLDRENETFDAASGEPLLPGDRLRTGSGLVEIWFPDGSIVDLDAYTTAELGSPSLIRLTEGRLILTVARGVESAMANSYQIDTPEGAAIANGPGEYRVSLTAGAREGSVELAVVRGMAQLTSDGGTISLRTGERAFARADAAPSRPEVFNAARMDTFGRWASARRDERLGRAASARYLPNNLQMYGGTFDRYGAWESDAANGYVWYPTVDPEWRPYYNGYWSPLRTYGMTWIGLDAWGWPTHHYGRWGYARSRWFWVPERRFAPAWVAWATAPDYVSWCPIGLDNRPVFSLSVSAGNHWAGWVVLPRSSFGARNLYVNRHAVEGRRLPRNTPFVAHSQAPPSLRGRANAGASRAGGLTVPRDSRPGGDRSQGRSAGERAGRDNRGPTAGVRGTTPVTPTVSPGDRERAYRRGIERQAPSPAESTAAPRAYGARPATPRQDTSPDPARATPQARETASGRVPPRNGQAGAARGTGPRGSQAGAAARDAESRDQAPGNGPTYSPPLGAPATPSARQPQPSPSADRDPRNRDAYRARSGDDPNRRSAGGAGAQESRPSSPRPAERASPSARPAERAAPPRESARPAPARESPPPRAEPRGEQRSSGDGGGGARSRDGGSGGHGRRNQ